MALNGSEKNTFVRDNIIMIESSVLLLTIALKTILCTSWS